MLKYASPKSTTPNAEVCLTKMYHSRCWSMPNQIYHTQCWSMPNQNLPYPMLKYASPYSTTRIVQSKSKCQPPTLYIGLFTVTASSPHRVLGRQGFWLAGNLLDRVNLVQWHWPGEAKDFVCVCVVPCLVVHLCNVSVLYRALWYIYVMLVCCTVPCGTFM